MKKISILGAGWLGTPLALALQEKGNTVLVSTTQEAKVAPLEEKGLSVLTLSLNPAPQGEGWSQFLACDILVINIPPRVQLGEENHIEQMKALVTLIQKQNQAPNQIIYTSSTSIYADGVTTYTEEGITLENTGHKTLFRAEQLLKEAFGKHLTILRLGGLCGPQRNLARFFAGKSDIKGGQHPVNMLHLDDAIGVISLVVAKNIKEQTFNVCSPMHPSRNEFYTELCAKSGMEAPNFDVDDVSLGKVISTEKLISLGFEFQYANPVDFNCN